MFADESINRVTLERVQIGCSQTFSRELIGAECEIREWIDGNFSAQLRGFLWGDPERTHAVTYPATWWQAFKRDYFPPWLLERFPVKWSTVKFTFRTLYPDFRPSVPNERFCVVVRRSQE